MLHVKSRLNGSVLFVLALLGASLCTPEADRAQADTPPFSGLEGKWSGDGSIALTNGTTERLRCDATYAVTGGGDNLDQTLRCASDTYNFDLRISLVDTAGAILGNWNELSKRVQGGISGRNSKGVIQATVRGQAFNAAVTVATHGTEQTVEIRAQSGDLSQVKITLHHAR
ncbi:MAG: hypothetical protein ABSG83_01895 [Roseiarcus sp.]|jgi:hypothetical protein